MKVALDLNFLNGFVKSAVASGQDPTEAARVYGRLAILSMPDVRRGFDRVMKQANISKFTASVLMQPEKLAALVDHVIQEGRNLMSEEIRSHLPEHQELTAMYKSAAARAAAGAPAPQGDNFLTRFDRLPLSDKLTLLAGAGAAGGAGYGLLRPSTEDKVYRRGPFSRFMRGAIGGAGTLAGAGLGATLGKDLAEKLNPGSESHPLGMILGGGAGALAGRTLTDSLFNG